jgi:hypothetical protein
MSVTNSDQCAELYGALAKAQGMMGRAFKDANNPAFRTKYTSLASVLEAILPAFNAAGLCVLQHPVLDQDVVHLTTLLTHESGQWMRSVCTMPVGGKRDAHAVGSAISYLRRYTLASICGVIQSDDDGNDASGAAPQAPARPAPSAPAPVRFTAVAAAPVEQVQLTDAQLAAAVAPVDYGLLKAYCAWHGKGAPSELQVHQQQQMLAWLKGKGAEVLVRFAEERARAEAEQTEQAEQAGPLDSQAVMDAIDEHAAKVGMGAKVRRSRKGGEA